MGLAAGQIPGEDILLQLINTQRERVKPDVTTCDGFALPCIQLFFYYLVPLYAVCVVWDLVLRYLIHCILNKDVGERENREGKHRWTWGLP